jgi:hypothetical protein
MEIPAWNITHAHELLKTPQEDSAKNKTGKEA